MRKTTVILLAVILLLSCERNKSNDVAVVIPSEQQIEWANNEVGVLIHFDMPNYVPEYNWRNFGTHPSAETFNPSKLNTDQWIEAAQKIGAKYAVLVAKHCSGFSLWPTEAHDYSIKNSPWKDGKGDIVGDFVASCKKYGIKPGLYASTSANGYCWVDNPGKVQEGSPYTQEEYNRIVEKQLTELWSNYGELFEVWFDGGVMAVEDGGADVLSLINKLQPNTIAFQGPYGAKNLIRWVGNEEGFSPDPCWSTADSTTSSGGVVKVEGMHGDPKSPFWCPGEADFTLRHNSSFQGGWFWKGGEDGKIFTVDELMTKYRSSVGRNTNMLIGLVIDSDGLVPQSDVVRLEEFGKKIQELFSIPIAKKSDKGDNVSLKIPSDSKDIKYIMLREDISKGERVLEYSVEAKLMDGSSKEIYKGTNIGNCRIISVDTPNIEKITVVVTKSKAEPQFKEIGAY